VGNGVAIDSHREMGLITGVFDERFSAVCARTSRIGHTRYSTTGSSVVCNAQPFVRNLESRAFRVRAQRQLTTPTSLPRACRTTCGAGDSDSRDPGQDDRASAPGTTWTEKIKGAIAGRRGCVFGG